MKTQTKVKNTVQFNTNIQSISNIKQNLKRQLKEIEFKNSLQTGVNNQLPNW